MTLAHVVAGIHPHRLRNASGAAPRGPQRGGRASCADWRAFSAVSCQNWGFRQGFNETLTQQKQNLAELQVGYTDLVLIHWPGPPDPKVTKDPACQKPDADGRWGSCRRATWRGMLELLKYS